MTAYEIFSIVGIVILTTITVYVSIKIATNAIKEPKCKKA